MNKILHGPYGSAWAYCVVLDSSMGNMGWHRADDEDSALAKAHRDVERFSIGPSRGVPVVDRVEPPVCEPKTGAAKDDAAGPLTDGVYQAEGVELRFGGACPVQGDGEVDGRAAYYRARGGGWSLDVELSDNESWTYGGAPYAWPDGGWLHRDESIANIETAVAAFRSRIRVDELAAHDTALADPRPPS